MSEQIVTRDPLVPDLYNDLAKSLGEERPTLAGAKRVMLAMINRTEHPYTIFGGACNTYSEMDATRFLKHRACVELCAEGKIVKLQEFDGGCTWGTLP